MKIRIAGNSYQTFLIGIVFAIMACNHGSAQPTPARRPARIDPAVLTVDRIYGANEFREEPVGRIVWSKKTDSYFTLAKPAGKKKGRDLIRVQIATGKKTVIVPVAKFRLAKQKSPIAVQGFVFSADESKVLIYTNSRRVWRRNTRGDYWVFDITTKQLKKLGGNAKPSTMMFAKFSPDGNRVAYVRERNLYVQNLDDMKIVPLTTDKSVDLINGTSDWVNEEELSIRDGYRWSPDGKSIAFWQFNTNGVRRFQMIDYTRGSYPKTISFAYPKVGERNSATRIGVVSAKGGKTRWLNLPGDPREHYLPRMEWTPDGKRIILQQMNRLQNTNRVMVADPKTGAAKTILTETDKAWLENDNPFRWVNSGHGFIWLSERSGWRHAYLVSIDGKTNRPITHGSFDVIKIEAIDRKGGWLYFAASPDNPTRRSLYRVRLDGVGDPQLVSPKNQPGWHTYDASPDARWAVHRYSNLTTPSVVELIRLADHRVIRVLTDNEKLRTKLAAVRMPSAELLKVDIGNNLVFDAWCLKPPNFDPNRKYPILIYVYGEPHGQTVRDVWQGQTGLWHRMLAQRGFLVVSIDNRGTMVPRGRAWRKCVYRKVGIIAPIEQAAAAKALLKRWPYADARRVGIWGWSGGGSMSLNAIFRYPDLYGTAIAVAPNASQLLYDTIYQERYMGLPKDNAKGFRDGSPITHAHRLKGNLLLVHGTGDDNCHYQGTIKLTDKLIALNKRFTVMPYPSRSHSISEGRNTRRHFYSLMTDYLLKHLR